MAKIFLVDDDYDLNEQNRIVLEAKGHHVIIAPTGKEALEMLKNETPDLFVVDVMMEHHRAGFELARNIGKRFATTPIIIVSGDTQKANWQTEAPDTWSFIKRFVEKPISASNLSVIIEEVLKENKKN